MSRRRRHRQHSGISAGAALDMADDMGMPDGAAMAWAAEMSGHDYDGFIAALVGESGGNGPQEASYRHPEFKVPKKIAGKIAALGLTLHQHDAYHRTVRRAGKVVADWWPHKDKFRIGGQCQRGDEKAFIKELEKTCATP